MALDPDFEPFSDDAIEARRYAPDVLMVLAEIAFGSEAEEQTKADALALLEIRLIHPTTNGLLRPTRPRRICYAT
jgi:hypothetical protein